MGVKCIGHAAADGAWCTQVAVVCDRFFSSYIRAWVAVLGVYA